MVPFTESRLFLMNGLCKLCSKTTEAKRPSTINTAVCRKWMKVILESIKLHVSKYSLTPFSSHTQDLITNSLCNFLWWQPASESESWCPHCFWIRAKATIPESLQCNLCQLRPWNSYLLSSYTTGLLGNFIGFGSMLNQSVYQPVHLNAFPRVTYH